MADPVTSVVKFNNRGLVLKTDPAHMSQGQYPYLFNMQSMQEGSICSRSGRKLLGQFSVTPTAGGAATEFNAHTIRKFYTSGADATIPRYIGWEDQILRILGPYANPPTVVATGVEPIAPGPALSQRWNLSTYSAGATGSYWAYFACANKMLKDDGTNVTGTPSSLLAKLQNWGIAPAFGVAGAFVANGATATGPDNTVSGATAYDYIFTFKNPVTGNESNPSQFMSGPSNDTPASGAEYITGIGNAICQPIAAGSCASKPIVVAFTGTGDPQIPTGAANTVVIYRRGGIYADGLFRRVGYAANPGLGNIGVFIDNNTDLAIDNAAIADFQNDPPVPSSLPQAVTVALAGNTGATIPNAAPGSALSSVSLVSLPSTVSLTPGTLVYFNGPVPGSTISSGINSNAEQCIISTVTGPTSFTTFLQFQHAAGESVTIDTICNQPCVVTCQGFDSVFVAGDPNNPHVLYKSKTGNPEQFPPVDEAGVSLTLNVGSPSNPIQNILNFEDNIICLNLNNIYEVPLSGGQMLGAYVTPAQRGLFQRDCYCKADNAIFYLSYDGIYSWTGGQSVKCSEQIDPIFNHRTVSLPYFDYPAGQTLTVYPVDLRNVDAGGASTTYFCMAYYHNSVYFSYRDINGTFVLLRYEPIYNRWSIEYEGPNTYLNFLYLEEDTGNLIASVGNTSFGSINISMMDEDGSLDIAGIGTTQPTTDDWSGTSGTSGSPISYDFVIPWVDLGSPETKKLLTRLQLEMDNTDYTQGVGPPVSQSPVLVAVSYDYGTTDAVDQFSIAANPINAPAVNGNPQWGRRLVDLPLQQSTLYPGSTVGKQARSFSIHISCAGTSNRNWFYSLIFTYTPLAEIQAGQNMDYTDLGHPADKRIYAFTITYDTGGQNITLNLDTRTGINAGTENIGVQSWTLNSNGKTVQDLAVIDGVIAKEIRLRTDVSAPNQFLEYTWSCPVYEKYPVDTVYFSPWEDNGNDYLKYVQQLDLDVDTGGQTIPVQLVTDTGLVLDTINVTTTGSDRRRTLTAGVAAPTVAGRQWRFLINPTLIPPGGKFQVFSHKWVLLQADKGPVSHSYDWDDLGYPYDKSLYEITFEYDTTTGGPLTLNMDTLTGILGNTMNTNVQSFVLGGSGRALTTYPINLDTVVKMIRIYPATQPQPGMRSWKYGVKKIDYPPDIISSTDFTLFGWPCEKIGRNIILDIDTGGVTCVVQPEVDGVLQTSYTVNTSLTDRQRIIPLLPNIIGRLWRLIFTPGVGGKNQLWNPDKWLDYVKEPCAVAYVDSYEQNFGYSGWKYLKQAFIHYSSTAPILFTVLVSGSDQFFSIALPTQPTRDQQRFYFPPVVGNVLNKSMIYRFQISCAAGQTFKLYADSRVEWVGIGTDQRGAFRGFNATPELQQPTAPLMM